MDRMSSLAWTERRSDTHGCSRWVRSKNLEHKGLRLESDDEPVTLRLQEDELASLPTGERIRKEAPARDSKTNNALSEKRTGHPLVHFQH